MRIAVLHILAVHPSYHRRGLGSMLIRPGLEAADEAGAQTYIEASPSGLPLYLRHGWEQVDEMVIDMTPYGGHGIAHQPFLMREPGAGSKLGKTEKGERRGEERRGEERRGEECVGKGYTTPVQTKSPQPFPNQTSLLMDRSQLE